MSGSSGSTHLHDGNTDFFQELPSSHILCLLLDLRLVQMLGDRLGWESLAAVSLPPRASPVLSTCKTAGNPRRNNIVLALTSAQNISLMFARCNVLALYSCTLGDAVEERFWTEEILPAEKKIAVLIPLVN